MMSQFSWGYLKEEASDIAYCSTIMYTSSIGKLTHTHIYAHACLYYIDIIAYVSGSTGPRASSCATSRGTGA